MKLFTSEKYIGTGKTVGIFTRTETRNQPFHHHDFIEIVYISSGRAIQQVNNASYEVTRGDVIFINYGSTHAFQALENFRYVNICFMPELLSNQIISQDNALALLSLTAFDEMRKEKNGGKLSFCGKEREEVEFILDCMLRETSSVLPYCNRIQESYLSILLTKMLRKSSEVFPENQDIWSELVSYISNNLEESLTLPSLAQRCFYNPSYFSRVFKQKFGCSLTAFVRSKRIAQAQILLQETELSVDSVISKVGYNDRSAFYHIFAKETGMTPAEYRAQFQKTVK